MSTQFTNRQWRLPNEENKTKVSNYSMDFDGSQYIDLGTTTDYDNGDLSASIWVYASSTRTTTTYAFSNSGSSSIAGFDIAVKTNNNVRVSRNTRTKESGSGWIDIGFTDDAWQHLAFTYNESTNTIKLFLNGVLKDISTGTTQSTIASKKLTIGSYITTISLWKGKLDGASIFNYTLSDGGVSVGQTATGDIAALYGSSSTGIGNPMSLSPKPVAYYPLGDQDAFNGANYLVPNSSLKDYVFDFDGSNDYIDCGTGSRFNIDQITISAWVKLSSGLTSTQVIAGIRNTNSGSICYQLQNQASGKFRFVISQSNGTYVDSVANDVHQYNTWYNVVGVADGSNIKLYINGDLQTIVNSYDGTIYSPNENFNIGRQSSPSNYYWDGKLSNAQIFNTALSATGSNSVETLYNNGSPLTSMSGFTSLQGWWKLDASATYDSSTTTWTIEDSSSNSNDGTSSGMTQANLVQSDLSFTSGYSPYALDFDSASSDELNISNNISSLNNTSSYSYSFWYNPTVANYTTNLSVLGSYSKGLSYYHYSDGNLYIHTGTDLSSAHITLTTSNNINLNNWNNVVFTFINGSCVVYINGSAAGTYTNSSNSTSTNLGNSISIGWVRGYNENFGVKKISNVSIWNTNLTSTQVTELYNEGVPSNLNNHSAYSNLVSWWQLGSNSSFNTNWTVLDEKGSNNGTSVNMTEDDIVDGVGSYANGLSSVMGGDEVIGDAPYSTANSLSVNMDVLDRVEDTPS